MKTCGGGSLRELGFTVAHEVDQCAMTGLTGSDQRAVCALQPIIYQWLTNKISEHPAGFVHQKVGRRKVPVMAAGRGQGSIELAMRYPSEAEGE
jgi:hypothetical protein